MLNSIEDIVSMHMSEGRIEDAYQRISFDNKTFIINKYTLRVRRGNMSREEARRWNLTILNEVKKNRNLYKEIREYTSLFQLLNRSGIKTGQVKKCESPDFLFYDGKNNVGIEITKIYVGTDWIAEKIAEEIKAYRNRKSEANVYDEYVKFRSKIVSFQIREGIVITQSGNDKATINEYITEIKNKIFEKIRKQIDDYLKCDKNIIFVEIASPLYFTDDSDIHKLNEEMKFYISHLDGFTDDRDYELYLKTATNWSVFNLKDGSYEII